MSSFIFCFFFCSPNQISYCSKHEVHIYVPRVPQCQSPRRNWDPSPPPLPHRVCIPPWTKGGPGGGTYSPADEGVGESQFGRLEKNPSTLSTLWFQVTAGLSALPFDNIWFGGKCYKMFMLTVLLGTYFMAWTTYLGKFRIFKLLRSPGIDSKESIPQAYVTLPVSTTALFLLGS